jgi:hypothetical protein
MKISNYFKLFIILFLLTFSSCFYRKNVTDSDLIVTEGKIVPNKEIREYKISLHGNAIESTLQQVLSGTFNGQDYLENNLENQAVVELRKKLFNDNFKIYLDQNSLEADLIIKIRCTEYVPLVQNIDDKQKIPTAQAASLITIVGTNLSTMAAVLGPLAGGIGAFGPLSGIALGSEEKELNSLVTFDIQVLKKDGEILLAKPYRATFLTKVLTKGNITTSNSKAVASSSISDAVRSAMELAYADIRKIIR